MLHLDLRNADSNYMYRLRLEYTNGLPTTPQETSAIREPLILPAGKATLTTKPTEEKYSSHLQ